MADERTSDSVKTRYDIALMNLNDIKIAVFRDSLSTYVEQKTGLTIQFNWPKSRCLVISTLCKIPFPTRSAAELQEMCSLLLCCPERLQLLGYVSVWGEETCDVCLTKTLVFAGEEEKFYGLDFVNETLYLLAETTERFAVLGLRRYDPVYREKDIRFLTKIDDVLQSLIDAQDNLWKFATIVYKNSGRHYIMKSCLENNDGVFVLFLTRKEDFPSRMEWNFFSDVYESMPYHGQVIGSIGKTLLYPKTMFVMMDLSGAIYGIDTIGTGIGSCVKIADDFESFLRQGIVRGYRRYKFFHRNISTVQEILPLCPHTSLGPTFSNNYIYDLSSEEDE
uniref:Tegument protein vICA n=2 Tax=Human betaherpesvirus 6A TaxID=32603 RepID=A0A219XZ26_9BETA|nr:tegument protein vICA [Human betaherpesvirus 6A]